MTIFTKRVDFCSAAAAALVSIVVLAFALALSSEALAQDNSGGAAAPAQATPQAATPPAAPPAAAPILSPQPLPAERPGFLHQLKVWWDDSMAAIDQTIKGSRGKPAESGTKTSGDGKAATDAGNGATAGAAQDIAKGAAAATQDAVKSAVEVTKGAATTATDAMKGAVEVTKNAASAIVRLPGTRVVDIHETCAKAPNGASDCGVAAATGCRAKGFSGGTPLDVRTAQKCDAAPGQSSHVAGAVACTSEAVVIRAVCQ